MMKYFIVESIFCQWYIYTVGERIRGQMENKEDWKIDLIVYFNNWLNYISSNER
jgi:hypothetical protein